MVRRREFGKLTVELTCANGNVNGAKSTTEEIISVLLKAAGICTGIIRFQIATFQSLTQLEKSPAMKVAFKHSRCELIIRPEGAKTTYAGTLIVHRGNGSGLRNDDLYPRLVAVTDGRKGFFYPNDYLESLKTNAEGETAGEVVVPVAASVTVAPIVMRPQIHVVQGGPGDQSSSAVVATETADATTKAVAGNGSESTLGKHRGFTDKPENITRLLIGLRAIGLERKTRVLGAEGLSTELITRLGLTGIKPTAVGAFLRRMVEYGIIGKVGDAPQHSYVIPEIADDGRVIRTLEEIAQDEQKLDATNGQSFATSNVASAVQPAPTPIAPATPPVVAVSVPVATSASDVQEPEPYRGIVDTINPQRLMEILQDQATLAQEFEAAQQQAQSLGVEVEAMIKSIIALESQLTEARAALHELLARKEQCEATIRSEGHANAFKLMSTLANGLK